MRRHTILPALAASVALLGLAACNSPSRHAAGDPPGTEATRALDRAAGTNTSGAYPLQSNGMPGNPPGTKATRALDRAAGTNTSGAYPQNSSR